MYLWKHHNKGVFFIHTFINLPESKIFSKIMAKYPLIT